MSSELNKYILDENITDIKNIMTQVMSWTQKCPKL